MTQEQQYEFVEGAGVPIVFVHGWLGSKRSWKQIREQLDVDNPQIYYDQRCHGSASCTAFDFEDLAADLQQLITENGLEEPIIVGHSMGGMVALTYAAQYEQCSGLVLLGTCASTPEPEVESPQFFLKQFAELPREKWAAMIADNYVPREENPNLWKDAKKELVAADKTPITCGLEAMVDYDVRDQLSNISAPCTVIAGEQDHAITLDKSQELAELLNCPLHRIDASHLMLQDAPEAIAQQIEVFVHDNS